MLVEELHSIEAKPAGKRRQAKPSLPAFSYPKGKQDGNETLDKFAILEVLEETGFNITGRLDPNLFFEERVLSSLCCDIYVNC